jgi:hypothetical protein
MCNSEKKYKTFFLSFSFQALCYADRLEGDKDENMDRSQEYAAASKGDKPPPKQRRQSARRGSWRKSGEYLDRKSTEFALRTSNDFADNYTKNPQVNPKMGEYYRSSILGQQPVIPENQRMSFSGEGGYDNGGGQGVFEDSDAARRYSRDYNSIRSGGGGIGGNGGGASSVTKEIRDSLRRSKIIEPRGGESSDYYNENNGQQLEDVNDDNGSSKVHAHTAKSLWPSMAASFSAPPAPPPAPSQAPPQAPPESRRGSSGGSGGSVKSNASPHTAKSLWPTMTASFGAAPANQAATNEVKYNDNDDGGGGGGGSYRSGGGSQKNRDNGREDMDANGYDRANQGYAGGGGDIYQGSANPYGGGGNSYQGSANPYGGGGGYGGGGNSYQGSGNGYGGGGYSNNAYDNGNGYQPREGSFDRTPSPHTAAVSLFPTASNQDNNSQHGGSVKSNRPNTIMSVFPDAPPERASKSSPFPTLTDM